MPSGQFVIAAGGRDTLDAVAPLFDAIGQRTFVVSGTPEAANLVKLSGNFLIASIIESLGEAMALVGKGRSLSHCPSYPGLIRMGRVPRRT